MDKSLIFNVLTDFAAAYAIAYMWGYMREDYTQMFELWCLTAMILMAGEAIKLCMTYRR